VLNVGIELLRRTGVDKINLTTQHKEIIIGRCLHNTDTCTPVREAKSNSSGT